MLSKKNLGYLNMQNKQLNYHNIIKYLYVALIIKIVIFNF